MKKVCLRALMVLLLSMLGSGVRAGIPPLQEKVFLHFDNNNYVQGDTIWWKAYVVRADNLHSTPLSRILHVELLNEQGYVLERQQVALDSLGQTHGQFALERDAFPGHYEVRAYTKWMMNFHDGEYMDFLEFRSENAAPYTGARVKGEEARRYVSEHPEEYVAYSTEPTKVSQRQDGTNIYDEAATVPHAFLEQNGIFSRVLSVYQRPAHDSLYRAKVMPAKITMGDFEKHYRDGQVNVRFFPEGGHLIQGVPCRLGWEAYDKEGQRLNVEGELLLRGKSVEKVRPLHAGRGRFLITPAEHGEYELRFEQGGKRYDFPLPAAEDEGCGLAVMQEDGKVRMVLQRVLRQPRQLYLCLASGGKLFLTMPLAFENDAAIVQLNPDELPAGVNEAVVIDEQESILADRLFFVSNAALRQRLLRVESNEDKGRMAQPLEQNQLRLRITDASGQPVANQTFSLAVRDRDQLERTFSAGGAATSLLLQSEVLGFVEDPEYYFEQGAVHAEALDQLLMIQGWRRYKWEQVAHPDQFEPTFLAEQGVTLNGRAYNLRRALSKKKQRGPVDVFCSLRLLGDRTDSLLLYRGWMRTDSLGQFNIQLPYYEGEGLLVLRASYPSKKTKDRDQLSNTHDGNIFLRLRPFHPLSVKALSWYELHTAQEAPRNADYWARYERMNYSNHILPEAIVKAKRRAHKQRQKDRPVMKKSFWEVQNLLYDIGYIDFGEGTSPYDFNASKFNLEGFLLQVQDLLNNQFAYDIFEERTISNGRFSNATSGNKWVQIMNKPEKKEDSSTNLAAQKMQFKENIDSIFVITDNPRRPANYIIYHQDRFQDPIPGFEDASKIHHAQYTYGIATFLNLKPKEDTENTTLPVGREYHLKGFSQPAECYTPTYTDANRPQQPFADHRRTLYWNPTLTTDANGCATVTFFNSQVCTEYDISIDGITPDGKIIGLP